MFVDPQAASSWVVVAFVKVVLWFTGASGLCCRSCRRPVSPVEAGRFALEGCECGSEKLDICKAQLT